MERRRKFCRDFKLRAVKLVTERGLAAAQAAKAWASTRTCRASGFLSCVLSRRRRFVAMASRRPRMPRQHVHGRWSDSLRQHLLSEEFNTRPSSVYLTTAADKVSDQVRPADFDPTAHHTCVSTLSCNTWPKSTSSAHTHWAWMPPWNWRMIGRIRPSRHGACVASPRPMRIHTKSTSSVPACRAAFGSLRTLLSCE